MAALPLTQLTQAQARSQFPGLQRPDFLFLENAGGSQVPQRLIDRVSSFYVDSYVQTGAMYPEAVRAEQTVKECHALLNRLFGGEGVGTVAIGGSASGLLQTLSLAYRQNLQPGDEIVINVHNHEAHVGPWVRLDQGGIVVKFWNVNQKTGLSKLEDLAALLTPRTRVVCFSATSNLLGERNDIAGATALAHSVGAHSIVDAVAWAPHDLLEVEKWDCDFCVVSMYKIFGPHVGALWGKSERWQELKGPNHFFLPDEPGKKFELGCLPYELLSGILGTGEYLASLGGLASPSRQSLETAFHLIQAFEAPLTEKVMNYLAGNPKIRLIGPSMVAEKHPTFSFVPLSKSSREVAEEAQNQGLAIKWGHMYAYRLCERLGIAPEEGVVRLSAVHTNTVEEIDRAIEIIDRIL